MQIESFVKIINSEFYTGVPDSQLKALCNFLIDKYGTDPKHHIIGINEGNCAAIATGYYLSTGKVPVVYMQNSGEGNAINPIASLMNDNVYGIPCIFIIGWRGEPGVHDEPQHVYQGTVTLDLLNVMNIKYSVVKPTTTDNDLVEVMLDFQDYLKSGKQVALVIKKGALEYNKKIDFCNSNLLNREEVIKHITDFSGQDCIVSTTGKASRELFEIRESKRQGHGLDFLTVGSMGHSSSIALGIALQKPQKKIWIIDGDGACLMHMGSLALIGQYRPNNIVHIVLNNGSHETVGGLPTVARKLDLLDIAKACGYNKIFSVNNIIELDNVLSISKNSSELVFVEVKCSIGSRANLGRPTTTPLENKIAFMKTLQR